MRIRKLKELKRTSLYPRDSYCSFYPKAGHSRKTVELLKIAYVRESGTWISEKRIMFKSEMNRLWNKHIPCPGSALIISILIKQN